MIHKFSQYGIAKILELWSLVTGLAITGFYLVLPKVTVHYPRQEVSAEAFESFRGPIELIGSAEDPAIPRCISCMLCVSACPSGCIRVQKSPPPKLSPEEEQALSAASAASGGEKVKRPAAPRNPAVWEYDFTRCSLCACCVEACPAASIRFSHDIYLSGTSREDFHFDLLSKLDRKARQEQSRSASEGGAC